MRILLIALLFCGCSSYHLNKGDVVRVINPKSKYYGNQFRAAYHELPDRWGIKCLASVSALSDTNYCSTYMFYMHELINVEF